MTINCAKTATEAHLQLTLNDMSNLLANGDAHGLASYFECPLPVYLADEFFLFQCRKKIAKALADYMFEMARCDIRRIEPSLVHVEDSTPRRSLFVARWNYYGNRPTSTSCNIVRYVGRRRKLDGLMRIELVEYLSTGGMNIPSHLFGAGA